jgi:hypothetical protein
MTRSSCAMCIADARPNLRLLCAWKNPPHTGAMLVGIGQQFDAMALERRDDLRPHLAADMSQCVSVRT